LINYLVISQQRSLVLDEESLHERTEAEIFKHLITSLIIKSDYAKIEDFFQQLGSTREDIVEIILESSNKYRIAEYNVSKKEVLPFKESIAIKIPGQDDYTLTLIYDRTETINKLDYIRNNLIYVSIVIFVLMSLILWNILVKMALNPLKDEISRHKKTSEELYKVKEEAIKANEIKSEFLANMSHEIRTPMNGVMGMLHLVSETTLSAEQKEYIDTAETSAKTLLVILNDILDFSKIEAGKLELERTDFDLHDAIANTVLLQSHCAFKKGIELAMDVDFDVPVMVKGDPTRLGQIISNLVGNAIKFTQQGEVVISVSVKNKTNEHTMLHFEITDTGIGISEEAQEKIFSSFSQEDGSTTRKFGGTGLGLTVSRQLSELMGGGIGVKSVINKGSTFWFEIRADVSELDSLGNKKDINLDGERILIVDDNATNRKILHKQLSLWGIEHELAENGKVALNKIESNKEYTCIILDMMMPVMDGLQVASKIKNNPATDPNIILLSSSSNLSVTEAIEEKIIETFLMKPVRSSILFNTISSLSYSRKNKESIDIKDDPENVKVKKYTGKKILVVEDNKINQKVISGVLSKFGIDITIANNGNEALIKLNKTPYDLIFMDCHMPVMDGYEATAEIRKNETNGKHINIIAMTANVMEGDKEECIAAGMDDYVSKPIKFEVLNECLEHWLEE
ncbi:MAG: response regulator, partial [Gammaproteobacteria bacterium]|nr:response regulator [Gammaproteobacteria bacterium]